MPALNRQRISQFGLFAGVLLLVVLTSSAQNTEPLQAPPEVVLQFRTEGDRRQFRLGDLIPVKFSYSSSIAGKYILVPLSQKLAGGRGREISCSPPTEPADSRVSFDALQRFRYMLRAPCIDGIGFGGSSACGDCNGEHSLQSEAISFPGVLNRYVRFPVSGRYTCYCSSADVTVDPPGAKARSALLVKSNPLVLDIVADPAWARAAAISYVESYEKLCRGDNVVERGVTQQCFDIAGRITYLDTLESLAAEVKIFDGRNHGWGNGFWEAIQQTSFPKDALRLMSARVQEPDFQVSAEVLESLAMWELRGEAPDAFGSAPPVSFHVHAVDKLRKYVRLLGDTLSRRNADVLQESAKTYRSFAEQSYCDPGQLISAVEQQQVLSAAGILQ